MNTTSYCLLATGLAILAFLQPTATARDLTFEDRVKAQEAIEHVYWKHRIWPKENPGPKPPLSAVLSDAAIRAKVEDYLRKSNAVAKIWNRPITASQLQAELDRMAARSRDPQLLSEIFAALGNDPLVIAETLARQSLADRLIRNGHAFDDRFQGDLERKARASRAACSDMRCLRAREGTYREATWVLAGEGRDASASHRDKRIVRLNAQEWQEKRAEIARIVGGSMEALPPGTLSDVEETADAFIVTSVVEETAGAFTTGEMVWDKSRFDRWWVSESSAHEVQVAAPAEQYTVRAPTAVGCTPDMWTEMPREFAELRSGFSVVWTGTAMIVWGGYGLNTGGVYDPATDTWRPTSTGPNGPAKRGGHTAVWTGKEMIAWGGAGEQPWSNTGGRYDPVTDTWAPTSIGANVPEGRTNHTAVWTGKEMIVWGGYGYRGKLPTGGRYDPITDSWTPTSQGANLPGRMQNHTAVWTGKEMIVWGGEMGGGNTNVGGRYDPVNDSWKPTALGLNVPVPRSHHTAVWTGEEMIIWGGHRFIISTPLNDGGRYDPVRDTWTPTSTGEGVPEARQDHVALWTGNEMIVWAGCRQGAGCLNSGGLYDAISDSWVPTSTAANVPPPGQYSAVWTGAEMIAWGGGDYDRRANTGGTYDPADDSWKPKPVARNVPASRADHTAVWTGAEMIIWGGTLDSSGGRYNPSSDSWVPTSAGANVPSARSSHTAVWTGTEMIIWGGYGSSLPRAGGRYNPLTDTWAPTPTDARSPEGRWGHTAVWTGTDMIVWGGVGYAVTFDNGGRYAPASDGWTPTSTADGVPAARTNHSAAWTGSEMIVWGGYGDDGDLNSGGRYDPATDSWMPTSTEANVPAQRSDHTAVWTGAEMIVWGGYGDESDLNSGGRYDPTTNTWTPTSTEANVPAQRSDHTAVWTGAKMIVWGGHGDESDLNSGGRYDPSTNTWTPASTEASVPAPRSSHSAVWTGSEMVVWGGVGFDGTVLNTGGRYCGNAPPIARAGEPQMLECAGDYGAVARLDGTDSSDPDGAQDLASFVWSDDSGTLARSPLADVSLELGTHVVTLTVTDKAGAAASNDTSISVRDTLPPVGGVTSPAAGQCFGPTAIPVTVTDSFKDVCDPAILRSYSPAPGPAYSGHGDYHVVVTAMDSSGNSVSAPADFTIDVYPPSMQLLSPPQSDLSLPHSLPFDIVFKDSDDDGATGGVIREVVNLQGCTIYDGATYGNKDGLLSDETMQLNQTELCRIAAECGFTELRNPEMRVEATDCGGNVGLASRTLPGGIRLFGGVCGQPRGTPVRVSSGETRLGRPTGKRGDLVPR